MNLKRDMRRAARQPGKWAQRASKALSTNNAPRAPAIALAAACMLAATAVFVAYRARKAEQDYPPAGRFIEIDGIKLHYLERGEGSPVVLLHGNGATAGDFEGSGLIDTLALRHRVIAFDRPGFGFSERPRDRIWAPHAQAALIVRALSQLNVQQPVIAAHSWATLVALSIARDFPRRIGGLVLISGYYFPTWRADTFLLSPPAIPILGDIMRYTISAIISRLIARPMIRQMFAPRPVSKRFRSAVPLPLMLRPSQLRAAAEESGLMPLAARALRRSYTSLTLPVTIIAGEGDRIADLERQAVRLHREIAGSELRTQSGVGHMFHYAAPHVVVQAIEDTAARASPSDAPLAGIAIV